MINIKKYISKFNSFDYLLKLLFVPILFELVIGGGGRYLEIGPLSYRMVFFIVSLFVSGIYILYKKKIDKSAVILTLVFTGLLVFSALVGFFSNAPMELILEDIKPLSYFFILFYFTIVIKEESDVRKALTIIRFGSIFLGISYIIVLLLLFFEYFDFVEFYNTQSAIGEMFFRNFPFFFYKGFVFLSIGFISFLFSESKYKRAALLFLFIVTCLTLTRGFLLFTVLIYVYYVYFVSNNSWLKRGVFFAGILLSLYLIPLYFESIGDKSESDIIRYTQIDQVLSSITPVSLLIGHGFGVGVLIRPVHMELSFLEIFHKQGLLGVLVWFSILGYVFVMYSGIINADYKKLAKPFLFSLIFIILQSGTNPYINNPLGISVFLLSFVVFSRMLEWQKKQSGIEN